jgi:tetratricopeptide (TPR) repeat protein
VLVAALNNLALACARSGETDAALALTTRALDLCSEQGDRHREAALHNNLADLLHQAGREPESMEHLKLAVTLFAEVGDGEAAMQPEVWKLVEW